MKAQRNTVQRQIILDAVINLEMHPTIEEVYLEIQKKHPSISKMTVYRNLRRLAEEGTISCVASTEASERYDGRDMQHYHFKCGSCGCILDVDMDYISGIDNEVQAKYGYRVDKHDVIFNGTCAKCKESGSRV